MRGRALLLFVVAACKSKAEAHGVIDAADPTDAGTQTGCSIAPTLVSYDHPAELPTGFDTRCDTDPVSGACTALDLKGWLYLPDPAQYAPPYEVLINNHGSGESPGEKCVDSSWFAERGWLVFVPHRRGHGESTGAYLDEYVTTYCSSPDQEDFCKMEYLHVQVDDVASAIEFVLGLTGPGGGPLGDPDQIAIMGHSYGGIVTVFANQRPLGQRAVVDISGGSQSWEAYPAARNELVLAAQDARTPALYLQPQNDRSIHATIDLAAAAGAACRIHQSAILPAIDVDDDQAITAADYAGDWDGDGADYDPRDVAHGEIATRTDLWGPMVNEFLHRYFRLPRRPPDSLCIGTSYVP